MTQWIVGCKSGVGLDYFENYRTVPQAFHRRRSVPSLSLMVLARCVPGDRLVG